MNLSWLDRMFIVGHTRRRVPILVHWSVPALALFFLGVGISNILVTASYIAAYLAMIVLHELGHQRAAEWRGCRVLAIGIYPLHGHCKYELPESRYDDALIAWGGPAAQFIVAAPLFVFMKTFGSTHIAPLDTALSTLGVVSPIVALFNLLPIRSLDGQKAWTIVPILWRRAMARIGRRRPQTTMEAMEEALRKAAKRQAKRNASR